MDIVGVACPAYRCRTWMGQSGLGESRQLGVPEPVGMAELYRSALAVGDLDDVAELAQHPAVGARWVGLVAAPVALAARRQALPIGHLQLDAARVQQHRPDHRQQGPTDTAQPYPPVPAHQADATRRARTAPSTSCSGTPGTPPRRCPCTTSPSARNTPSRRSWPPPGSRQTAPGCCSPVRTTTACTCSTGPTGSCPTAGACSRPCRPATREMPA